MSVRVGSMPTGMNLNRGYRLREGFHIPPRMSIKDTVAAVKADYDRTRPTLNRSKSGAERMTLEQVANNLEEARKHAERAYNHAMGVKARKELEIALGALSQARRLLSSSIEADKEAKP